MMLKIDYLSDGKEVTKGVDVNLTEADLALPFDQVMERILRPALRVLFDNITDHREYREMIAQAKKLGLTA